MNDKIDKTTPFWVKAAEMPWIQGSVQGATVLAMVTPLLKWTNHVYKNEKMPRGSFFSGAGAYACSAAPMYAAAFAVKDLLGKIPEKTTQTYDLFSSFAAGGFSGLVSAPFEAIAQNKQLTKSSSTQMTVQQMRLHHGYSAFFRGAISIMMREGVWSTVYMSAIPMVAEYLENKGVDKHFTHPMALLMVSGAYGLFSSPLNQLRYRKQAELTKPSANKSYLAHAKDIYNQDLNASRSTRVGFFFKAAVPRMATTTAAAGLLIGGKYVYKNVVDYLKPDNPTPSGSTPS